MTNTNNIALRARIALFALTSLVFCASSVAEQSNPIVEGWLAIVWGDQRDADASGSHIRVTVTDDEGQSTELQISAGLLQQGVWRWNGRHVSVFAPLSGPAIDEQGAIRVAAIQLSGEHERDAQGGQTRGGVSGSEPWISLLCKFSDINDEPQNLAYFQGMYANVPGGLDHYWRELSYDAVDIVGSIAIDWVTLPQPQSHYVPNPGSGTGADLDAIFDGCTAAVDSFVDFSGGGVPFSGINLMLNSVLDCCAWGGSRFDTLDGITKSWRTTWNPPWAFNNEAVIAHEMGHGFGLPHANNFDGDNNPYDSPWDVMSSTSGYAVSDPVYGNLGKHINAFHKDSLGWFPPDRRFEPADDSLTSILLDHTALAAAENYQIAIIPIDTTRWYTVEARMREGDYDGNLAGDAVIIHQIDTTRQQPSWAYDADIPPANYGDNPGTMWTPGETFVDADNAISVTIDFETATGFGITIERGDSDLIMTDGF